MTKKLHQKTPRNVQQDSSAFVDDITGVTFVPQQSKVGQVLQTPGRHDKITVIASCFSKIFSSVKSQTTQSSSAYRSRKP